MTSFPGEAIKIQRDSTKAPETVIMLLRFLLCRLIQEKELFLCMSRSINDFVYFDLFLL